MMDAYDVYDFFKGFEVTTIDFGIHVCCDLCGVDFTKSKKSGGFLFGNTAVCPDCAPRVLDSAKKHNEEEYIKAFCPEDMSFGDFVRSHREID